MVVVQYVIHYFSEWYVTFQLHSEYNCPLVREGSACPHAMYIPVYTCSLTQLTIPNNLIDMYTVIDNNHDCLYNYYCLPQIHSEHLCGAPSRSPCHQHYLPTTSPYQQDVQSDPSIGLHKSRWPLQDVGPPRGGSGCVRQWVTTMVWRVWGRASVRTGHYWLSTSTL